MKKKGIDAEVLPCAVTSNRVIHPGAKAVTIPYASGDSNPYYHEI